MQLSLVKTKLLYTLIYFFTWLIGGGLLLISLAFLVGGIFKKEPGMIKVGGVVLIIALIFIWYFTPPF